jgi:hypothetical protein
MAQRLQRASARIECLGRVLAVLELEEKGLS